MKYFFFDTSGLAKRYINETGSVWVRNNCSFASGNIVFVAEITSVEITSAITRRSRGGSLTLENSAASIARFDADLRNEYVTLEITSDLLNAARLLVKTYALRGYDAVQLAVAIGLNLSQTEMGLPTVTFVSADNELLDAARAEGLSVENPNNYP